MVDPCEHTFIIRSEGLFTCQDCGEKFKHLPGERPTLAVANDLLHAFNLGVIDLHAAAKQAQISVQEFANQFLTYAPTVEREWHELLDLNGTVHYSPYRTPDTARRTSCPLEVDDFFKHKQNVLKDYHRIFPDIVGLESEIDTHYNNFKVTIKYVDSSRQLVLVYHI